MRIFSDGVWASPVFVDGSWKWVIDGFTMDAYTGVCGEDGECTVALEATTPEGLITERFDEE